MDLPHLSRLVAMPDVHADGLFGRRRRDRQVPALLLLGMTASRIPADCKYGAEASLRVMLIIKVQRQWCS